MKVEGILVRVALGVIRRINGMKLSKGKFQVHIRNIFRRLRSMILWN